MKSLNKKGNFVYLLAINVSGTVVYKVGFSTNIFNRMTSLRNLEKPSSLVKYKGLKLLSMSCVEYLSFDSIEEALDFERNILTIYKDIKYQGKPLLPNGNTELLTSRISLTNH